MADSANIFLSLTSPKTNQLPSGQNQTAEKSSGVFDALLAAVAQQVGAKPASATGSTESEDKSPGVDDKIPATSLPLGSWPVADPARDYAQVIEGSSENTRDGNPNDSIYSAPGALLEQIQLGTNTPLPQPTELATPGLQPDAPQKRLGGAAAANIGSPADVIIPPDGSGANSEDDDTSTVLSPARLNGNAFAHLSPSKLAQSTSDRQVGEASISGVGLERAAARVGDRPGQHGLEVANDTGQNREKQLPSPTGQSTVGQSGSAEPARASLPQQSTAGDTQRSHQNTGSGPDVIATGANSQATGAGKRPGIEIPSANASSSGGNRNLPDAFNIPSATIQASDGPPLQGSNANIDVGAASLQPVLHQGSSGIQLAPNTPVSGMTPSPQFPVNAVAVHVAQQAQAGAKRFEIRLDPPELGRLEIRLDVSRDGQATTHLIVERAETLDLLQRDARHLERALQNSGLDVSKDGLTFSLKNQSLPNQGHRQDGASGNWGRDGDGLTDRENHTKEATPDHHLIARYDHLIASDHVDIRI